MHSIEIQDVNHFITGTFMSSKGNRQKVENETLYQGLQCQLRATDRRLRTILSNRDFNVN
jgi:hypothetical protein